MTPIQKDKLFRARLSRDRRYALTMMRRSPSERDDRERTDDESQISDLRRSPPNSTSAWGFSQVYRSPDILALTSLNGIVVSPKASRVGCEPTQSEVSLRSI
jgi:hypothetical protein